MSTSRLEKFIYAICSMEVSDLPAPLSRIEILWNCLITGETPDFEPQSRNEQYLMAMLGLYDLENLPAPMSRGEKLLYKIAVGETDLSDVPGYLSRYEELLKYLIENGVLSDFEYVLYTLNQSLSTLYATVEKPVKSAILKGQTMINYAQITSHNFDENRTPIQNLNKSLEIGKSYTIIMNIVSQTVTNGVTTRFGKNKAEYMGIKNFNGVGLHKYVFTATNDFNQFAPYVNNDEYQTGLSAEYNQLMILEGDYTNIDIPYFEGMQSVKMPVLTTVGKNLFDMNHASYITGLIHISNQTINQTAITKAYYIPCEPNTSYTISKMMTQYFRICETSVVPTFGCAISNTDNNPSKASLTITTSESAKYLCFNVHNVKADTMDESEVLATLQIEKGLVATSYEPHQSNILTVNEPVELRGIGGVQDTLDCLTGEVVQNIGEMVLDGSESWKEYASQELTNTRLFYCGVPTNNNINTSKFTMINNRFASLNPNSGGLWDTDVVGLGDGVVKNAFRLRVLKSTANTIDELKEYLHSNPIVVQYELAEKSIKTVDLTTVDQDGQPTKLKTFNDISYVEINADSIIPSVDVEVATKISETLSTLGLEHHDISNTQNELGQTIDEQSENTDATMMATTEIYEQTL